MPKVGDHILGVGAESTWSTAVAPTARFECASENLKLEIERVESKALKSSRRYLSSSGWAAGTRSVSGDVELELPSNGAGLFVKNLLGAPTTSTPAGATTRRKHVFGATTLVDDQSLTFEIVRTDYAGTAHRFTYSGCVLDELTIGAKTGEFVTAQMAIDGKDEVVAANGAQSASYATSTPLVFTGAAITVAGNSFAAKEFEVKLTSGRVNDRYTLGSTTKLKQVEAGLREVTGSITCEWAGTTAYQRFVDGTAAAIVAKFETATAIEGSAKGYFQITMPVCRFDGETPTGGGELLEHQLSFVALDNGTDAPVEVELLDLTASY
jgi:hypothetical protein